MLNRGETTVELCALKKLGLATPGRRSSRDRSKYHLRLHLRRRNLEIPNPNRVPQVSKVSRALWLAPAGGRSRPLVWRRPSSPRKDQSHLPKYHEGRFQGT